MWLKQYQKYRVCVAVKHRQFTFKYLNETGPVHN